MDKDGYHCYDMSKLTVPNSPEYSFHQPPNNIIFYNTIGGTQTEVLRITKDGITANPNVPTDEAADAVIRALDGYIKNLIPEEQDPDELTMAYLSGVHDGKKQRTWVGLTDDDLEAAMDGMYNRWDIAEAIEAKLKEKNHG